MNKAQLQNQIFLISLMHVGASVTFDKDVLPYRIIAMSQRFVILVRKLNRKHDDDLIKFEVTRGACLTKNEAWNSYKKDPVYTIIDLQERIRSTNNLVFNSYDYWKQIDCEKCIADLIYGKIELSKRNKTNLFIKGVSRCK